MYNMNINNSNHNCCCCNNNRTRNFFHTEHETKRNRFEKNLKTLTKELRIIKDLENSLDFLKPNKKQDEQDYLIMKGYLGELLAIHHGKANVAKLIINEEL